MSDGQCGSLFGSGPHLVSAKSGIVCVCVRAQSRTALLCDSERERVHIEAIDMSYPEIPWTITTGYLCDYRMPLPLPSCYYWRASEPSLVMSMEARDICIYVRQRLKGRACALSDHC